MINVSLLESRQQASLWHIFASVKKNNNKKKVILYVSWNLLMDYELDELQVHEQIKSQILGGYVILPSAL